MRLLNEADASVVCLDFLPSRHGLRCMTQVIRERWERGCRLSLPPKRTSDDAQTTALERC